MSDSLVPNRDLQIKVLSDIESISGMNFLLVEDKLEMIYSLIGKWKRGGPIFIEQAGNIDRQSDA